MARYTEVASKAGDRVVSALTQAEEATISALSSVSKTVGGYIPEMPSLPFADKLPSPMTVVETTFDIGQHMLKSQKQYAVSFLKAVAPVAEKVAPGFKMQRSRRKAPARTV